MAIGLTDSLEPLGAFPLVQDVDLQGGYQAVASIAERNAIDPANRKEGMLARVASDGGLYILGAGLGNGDWQAYTPINIDIDIHLSEFGSDLNDGLSLGLAVATWARAWEIAANSSSVTLHLVGTVGGYEAPPTAVRWLTITGDENFTDVATGVAGASTDAQQLELAVATTEDAYRHFTVIFTSGSAVGYRRTIRDNSTTIVTHCQAFENHTASVVPAPGDTYRIVRPSARIGGSASIGGSTYRQFSFGEVPRVDLINVAVALDNPGAFFGYNVILPPDRCSVFGALVEGPWNVESNRGTIFAGVDNFQNRADVEALTDKLTLAGYIPGQWHGWGISFADSTFNFVSAERGGYQSVDEPEHEGGTFVGFITSHGFNAYKATLLGGSAARISFQNASYFAVANLPRNFSIPATPLLLKENSGYPFGAIGLSTNGTLIGRYTYSNRNVGIEVRHNGSTTNGIITIGAGSTFASGTGIECTYTGAASCAVVRARSPGGSFSYRADGFGGLPLWTMGSGTLVDVAGGAQVRLASFSMTGASGVLNEGGEVSVEQVGSSVPTAVVTGQLWRQTAGQSTLEEVSSWTGDDAALLDISGGYFIQSSGTVTITNNATGAADVLRARSGAQVNILGAAATVLDGSAAASGYAINARGGGRVFTENQPSSCTGATEDLTVGTGVNETQPDTFLALSGSSLVFGDTLSSIARST